MKKLICILAGAALLGACGQKTEVVVPASSPAPEKPDASLTGQKPRRDTNLTTAATPAVSAETKIDDAATAAKKEIEATAATAEKKIDAAAAAVEKKVDDAAAAVTDAKAEASEAIKMSTPSP